MPLVDLTAIPEYKTSTGLRVLIVDDNADHAMMMNTLVGGWGHVALMARTSSEAVKTAETFRPRVVLLDLGLPDRHGYDLAEMLRHQAGARKIFFIAVTGWTQIADQIRSAAAGVNHHLIKPANHDVLRELLSAYAHTNDDVEAARPL